MTILNFALSEDSLFVMSDTLVSRRDGQAAFFTSKIHTLPHWDGVICGTGSLAFTLAWVEHALGGILAQDIVHVDSFATESLIELKLGHWLEFEEDRTTTIYHFGYSHEESRFVGFAYRSANDFVSERLGYGLGIKPPVQLPEQQSWSWPDDFIKIAKDQRVQDDALPSEKRVGVGGHITSYMMDVERAPSGDRVRTTVTRPYSFPDYSEMYDRAVHALWEEQDELGAA